MRAGRSMLYSLFVRDFLLLRPPSPHSPTRSEKDVDQKRNRKTPSWCGSRKRKAARTPYDARITEYAHQGHLVPPRSILKTPEQIVGIRESGKINIYCFFAIKRGSNCVFLVSLKIGSVLT